MNRKAIFITTTNINQSGNGISKKILSQIKALQNLGYDVDISSHEGSYAWISDAKAPTKSYIKTHLRYTLLSVIAREIEAQNKKYDLAYIRNPHGGLYALFLPKLLSKLRARTKTIILEIPNFPYDAEASSLKTKISTLAHQSIRPALKKYIDEIIFMGTPQSTIWGIPSVQIFNCCDQSKIPECNPGPRTWESLRLIGVANLADWHGYDRLVMGLREYYDKNPSRNVEFHIVGDTEPVFSRLKALSKNLNLDNKIIFHGRLDGKALDQLFDGDVIGVDALGRHRSGNNYNDSIKSKEYCFRGIPFIKSHLDVSLEGASFILNLPPDESPIDINSIALWAASLKIANREIIDFAKNRFTWEKQFSKSFNILGQGGRDY